MGWLGVGLPCPAFVFFLLKLFYDDSAPSVWGPMGKKKQPHDIITSRYGKVWGGARNDLARI